MMRLRTWIPAALLLAALPLGAEIAVAQFPSPPPRPVTAPQAEAAPVPMPPPVIATPSPAPAAPAAPPSGWSFGDVLASIITTLLGLFVGNQTKQTWWPPQASGATPFKLPQNMTEFLAQIKDPETRRNVDQELLAFIQTGVPGRLLQGGLGMVPGVGGFAAQLEPVIRNVVIDVLNKRAAAS